MFEKLFEKLTEVFNRDKSQFQHIPDRGEYKAIRTKTGEIYVNDESSFLLKNTTHTNFAIFLDLEADELESGGYITNGIYEPSWRSDILRWAEQAKVGKKELVGV